MAGCGDTRAGDMGPGGDERRRTVEGADRCMAAPMHGVGGEFCERWRPLFFPGLIAVPSFRLGGPGECSLAPIVTAG